MLPADEVGPVVWHIMTPALRFDIEDPPAEPPDGANIVLWRLAHRLYRKHLPDTRGRCMGCHRMWPCMDHRLAVRGLVAVCLPAEPNETLST